MTSKIWTVADAFSSRKDNQYSRWSVNNVSTGGNVSYYVASDRVFSRSNVICDVAINPSFKLSNNARVFTIGSCFARNIERNLSERGFAILSNLQLDSRYVQKIPGETSGFLNRFTVKSIVSELKLATGSVDGRKAICEHQGEIYWQTLIRAANVLGLEEALFLRSLITDLYKNISSSDLLIITLGLTETWIDSDTGLGMNGPPPPPVSRLFPGRFYFVNEDVQTTINGIKLALNLIRILSPEIKSVFTVSPVPLGSTFGGEDIVLANSISKSTLRVAIQSAIEGEDGCDYFPSYEMAMWGDPQKVWANDALHVREDAVSLITQKFVDSYLQS